MKDCTTESSSKNWTHGFDELKKRVQEYPPERVAEITWLHEEDIVQAARMFAVDKPGCIQVGSSLERQANCGQTLRAIICLLAITGNIERPGSMISWALPETGLLEDFFFEIPLTEEMQKNIVGSNTYRLGAARTAHADTVIKQLLSGRLRGQGLVQRGRPADPPSGQHQGGRARPDEP